MKIYIHCIKNITIKVVPLRFGAGVKGKIVEAAYNQIPIVTTSIGGEGLDNSLGAFIIEDDAEKMSEIIIKLYVDYSKLKQMSDSGKKFIETYFSNNRAKEIIMKDIN
jgi:glycosyltransferase involved in cell wall biosynthesis